MRIKLLLLCFFLSIGLSFAQGTDDINTEYRAEREKLSDLGSYQTKSEF